MNERGESTPEFDRTLNGATDATGGGWLTVSQAAAAVGVSEKTLRKRIASGGIAAERVALPSGGWAWRVDADRLETSNRFQPREGSVTEGLEGVREAVGSAKDGVTELLSTDIPTASNRSAELPSPPLPSVSGVTAGDESTVALLREALARERENADRWRAQVEAANRDAAELRAALREALRLHQKALPEGSMSTHVSAPQSPPMGAHGVQSTSGTVTPSTTANSVQNEKRATAAREPRPLWKVVLGIR